MRERWLDLAVASLLRVPPRPEPPAGAPGSVQVFNAAPGFYRYRLLRWAVGQAGTAAGLVLGLVALDWLEIWSLPVVGGLFELLEVVGVVAFLLQLPFTLVMLRLDYRYRWYMVTDTTLRIREGLLKVREQTMTFANIQNLSTKQGPVQRLLGIADLKVRTAGGGSAHSGKGDEPAETDSMHLAFFRGVSNADEVRDLIMARMRSLVDSGLGDPDEVFQSEETAGRDSTERLQAAALELLAETRQLRRALVG